MKVNRVNLSRMGISRKFSLAFALMFFLMLLIAATAYFTILSIRNAGEEIQRSTRIGQQVLEMDRGMERARRLLNDFIIQHQRIGLEKAHELYAQTSIRQIAQVILISSDLRDNFFNSPLKDRSNINQADVNLYLASANRFATTSIEAVELITRRAVPVRGVEARIHAVTLNLQAELQYSHDLHDQFTVALSFYRDYLINRQRHHMQSAFNINETLLEAVAGNESLQTDQKKRISNLLGSYRDLAEELITVDLELIGKIRDFSLQERATTPISNGLVEAVRQEVEQANQRINQTYRMAGIIILIISILGVLAMLTIDRLLHRTVINKILRLTESASELRRGNLAVRADEESQDELGQLGSSFNTMASRVQDLVENLEQKVELRTAERAVSESFYRQLFDHSSSGVAVYEAVDDGRNFVFRDINKAGEKMNAVRRDDLLGRRVTEIFPAVEEFGLLDVFHRVWKTGKPGRLPVSWYQDGRLQGWWENRVYRLPTGEVVAVYDDVTLQKQMEEDKKAVALRLRRARKMEALGLMAGGVAHDLNNILTAITGYPDLLLMQLPEESDLRKPIEAMKESGERAAAVVADLLTVARGAAGVRTVINLNTLVTEYLDSPEYQHMHSLYPLVQCRQTLVDNLPDISCSPVHIKKCIMNLLLNAAEAIEDSGSITIATQLFTPDLQWAQDHGLEQETYVVLTVSDTGSGISEESVEHVFEPFYTKKVMGRSGTGLGLAVVWNTVKEHEGTVTVSSGDEGTTFKLFFPVTEDTAAQPESVTEENQKGGGETILIVDDEPQLRDVAATMLELLGYRVTCMNSGEAAVDYLHDHYVDLVVLDMLMDPGINGRRTYEQIVKLHPGQKAVVASGFAESDEVLATLQLGAGEFIKKPYSLASLGGAVRKVLDT